MYKRQLEDQLLKYFPEEIEKHKGFIKGFESDLEVLAAHPHPEDGFAGMEIRGDLLTDKENAGAALLDACKEVILCLWLSDSLSVEIHVRDVKHQPLSVLILSLIHI